MKHSETAKFRRMDENKSKRKRTYLREKKAKEAHLLEQRIRLREA